MMKDRIRGEQLLESLKVKPEGSGNFIGESRDLGWGRIFGGRMVAQALSAAMQNCPEKRRLHSLHCYFLRIGDVKKSVNYSVETLREGMSYSSRRVLARQDNHEILHLSASFQNPQHGFEHQDKMPPSPAPETLRSDGEILEAHVETLPERLKKRMPGIVMDRITGIHPLEIRPTHPENFLSDRSRSPDRRMWMRIRGPLPDDPKSHQLLMAYASDFALIGTALQPHGLNTLDPLVRAASINHVLWFHAPARMDQWNLFSARSTRAAGGLALVRGEFFNKEGTLIASFAQEGLIRRRGS